MARWRGFKNKAECCYYCWEPVRVLRERGIYMTVDHVIPRCRGGTSDYENLVTACERCNNMKGDSLEWYEGCVAMECDGDPIRFRELIVERGKEENECLERSEEESREPAED